MPTVKALSSQSRPSMIGISRPTKLPGPSKISCVWPWSAAACECEGLSCEWLCDMMVRVWRNNGAGVTRSRGFSAYVRLTSPAGKSGG
jgi:hypothetical protein